jgi:hypothetical protein
LRRRRYNRPVALFVVLVALTIVAAVSQYLSAAPTYLFASAVAALAGMVVALLVVWRSRHGPRAVTAAILLLADMVLMLRAVITPR